MSKVNGAMPEMSADKLMIWAKKMEGAVAQGKIAQDKRTAGAPAVRYAETTDTLPIFAVDSYDEVCSKEQSCIYKPGMQIKQAGVAGGDNSGLMIGIISSSIALLGFVVVAMKTKQIRELAKDMNGVQNEVAAFKSYLTALGISAKIQNEISKYVSGQVSAVKGSEEYPVFGTRDWDALVIKGLNEFYERFAGEYPPTALPEILLADVVRITEKGLTNILDDIQYVKARATNKGLSTYELLVDGLGMSELEAAQFIKAKAAMKEAEEAAVVAGVQEPSTGAIEWKVDKPVADGGVDKGVGLTKEAAKGLEKMGEAKEAVIEKGEKPVKK